MTERVIWRGDDAKSRAPQSSPSMPVGKQIEGGTPTNEAEITDTLDLALMTIDGRLGNALRRTLDTRAVLEHILGRQGEQ